MDVQLVFMNNSADAAGNVLYSGAIDNCILTHGLDSSISGEVFDMILHNCDTEYNTTLSISSVPHQICKCENNLPDCSLRQDLFQRQVYPGETFQVSVVAVGQRKGTVPIRVISNAFSFSAHYQTDILGSFQQASKTCTELNCILLSLSQSVVMEFHAEGSVSPCSVIGSLHTLEIIINISESGTSCVCEPRLAHYTNNSNINNGLGQITPDFGRQFWVGYDNQSNGLIVNTRCPFDYCVTHKVTFALSNTESRCAHNRFGILCGCCKEGYSLVVGTSQCWNCTNNYHLALLVPFAVMGVALVFFLLVCKLTVATGTLSGLVLYHNIIGVNCTIFVATGEIY